MDHRAVLLLVALAAAACGASATTFAPTSRRGLKTNDGPAAPPAPETAPKSEGATHTYHTAAMLLIGLAAGQVFFACYIGKTDTKRASRAFAVKQAKQAKGGGKGSKGAGAGGRGKKSALGKVAVLLLASCLVVCSASEEAAAAADTATVETKTTQCSAGVMSSCPDWQYVQPIVKELERRAAAHEAVSPLLCSCPCSCAPRIPVLCCPDCA